MNISDYLFWDMLLLRRKAHRLLARHLVWGLTYKLHILYPRDTVQDALQHRLHRFVEEAH